MKGKMVEDYEFNGDIIVFDKLVTFYFTPQTLMVKVMQAPSVSMTSIYFLYKVCC